MKDTERLYGINIDTKPWAIMPYAEVLELKVNLAYKRIEFLNTSHYMDKDSANVTDCVNAMKFNEALLKEMK